MEPIIKHIFDTDLYKLTMLAFAVKQYPEGMVHYEFKDRNNTCYPKGFAELLNEQINYLGELRCSDSDAAWMKRVCPYMPTWFFTFLKGYRFNVHLVHASQDDAGHLKVEVNGLWIETILYEVMLLAIISELYHRMNGDLEKIDMEKYYKVSYEHARKMLEAGCYVSDFGTRRRLCLETQEIAIRAFIAAEEDLKREGKCLGKFTGTSNVMLAQKYNLVPRGTHAHECLSFIAAVEGVNRSNAIFQEKWSETFSNGELGIFLYDTWGFENFAQTFTGHYARAFGGLRVDSGDNIEQFNMICDLYRSLGVDPATKQIIFSNALTTDEAIAIHKIVSHRMLDSYGIGTHLTSYIGKEVFKDKYLDSDGEILPQYVIKQANIVMKLLGGSLNASLPMNKTCKMSNDIGKVTGDEDVVNVFKFILHLLNK